MLVSVMQLSWIGRVDALTEVTERDHPIQLFTTANLHAWRAARHDRKALRSDMGAPGKLETGVFRIQKRHVLAQVCCHDGMLAFADRSSPNACLNTSALPHIAS